MLACRAFRHHDPDSLILIRVRALQPVVEAYEAAAMTDFLDEYSRIAEANWNLFESWKKWNEQNQRVLHEMQYCMDKKNPVIYTITQNADGQLELRRVIK